MRESKSDPEPLGWANWRALTAGKPSLGAIEVGCYSDASITGELKSGLGPLQVLNTVPGERQIGLANMALVLRVDMHAQLDPAQIRWSQTDTRAYSGADIGDELASLLALALGIRCRSGGMIRNFEPGAPRGIESAHVRPYLPPPRFRRAPVLPEMDREVSLEQARDLFERHPHAGWRKAIALVRAARLYEQAMWGVGVDPNLSWLLLVSAVETAAAEVHGISPRGTRRHPVGPTSRFVDFVVKYAPPAPKTRPMHGALDWSGMRDYVEKIYNWRSRALHDGIPFPSPMCLPPREYDRAYEERPTGLASASGTTVWTAEDTPMMLWTFAYIARGALVRWWRRTPKR